MKRFWVKLPSRIYHDFEKSMEIIFNMKYRLRIIRGRKKKKYFPRVITINLSSINRILTSYYSIFFFKKRRLFHSRIPFFRHLTSNFEWARGNVSSVFNRLYIGLSKLSLFRVTPLIRNLHNLYVCTNILKRAFHLQ